MIEWHVVFLVLFVLSLTNKEENKKDVFYYQPELLDPYLKYDEYHQLFLEENNSVVEVLPKPCDTKVDRSS